MAAIGITLAAGMLLYGAVAAVQLRELRWGSFIFALGAGIGYQALTWGATPGLCP